MKKILQRTFLGIFGAIFVVVAALLVKNFTPTNKDSGLPTVTDVNGNQYVALLDEAGVTYAAVTDTNGTIWAAEYKADGTIGNTVVAISNIVSSDDLPYVYDGPRVDETVANNDYTGQVNQIETTAPTTQATQPTSSNSPETTTAAPQSSSETLLIKKYKKMFEDDNYYIELTTDDKELGSAPIAAAAKNGNIYISTSVDGMSAKIIYNAKNDISYIVIDKFRLYGKLTKELLGEDTNMSEMNMAAVLFESVPNDDEIFSSEAQLNGKTLHCESFTRDDGAVMKYYFDGENLVRIDIVTTDGNTQSTYISKISSTVDDSLFEVPRGYFYMDLSKLL